ncbi:hypothetical protein [Rhabdaerophilum calidifontis]|uniref:hypothetical protein n=1 Tax=Rhabdaerophilum calidifontis TaxID=2604328 RepID=UPI00123862EB|nr:hypothetical protein [Rhabdaerophilum calidifontis]
MTTIVSTVKYSRPFEIWKIGFNNVVRSINEICTDERISRVDSCKFSDKLTENISEDAGGVFVFGSAAPWRKKPARGYLFPEPQYPDGETGVPEARWQQSRVSTMAIAALSQPANFPPRFRQMESKKKTRRVSVILTGSGRFQEKSEDFRFQSYLQFTKIEIGAFLDTIAENSNIHVTGISTAETRGDVDYDMQDLILRMRASHAPIAHSGLNGHEILSIASNSQLVLTDCREVAAAARRCGAQVCFFSDVFSEDLPEYRIYSDGFFEPYSISAAAIERRIRRLNAQSFKDTLEEIENQVEALQQACLRQPALVIA